MKKILIIELRPGIGDLCMFIPRFHEIKKKFQVLIKENQELANQNQSMKDQLNSINANEQIMVNEINELKEKYKILKMSKKLDGQETENSTELKLKINEMVKEIDKCIALLNK